MQIKFPLKLYNFFQYSKLLITARVILNRLFYYVYFIQRIFSMNSLSSLSIFEIQYNIVHNTYRESDFTKTKRRCKFNSSRLIRKFHHKSLLPLTEVFFLYFEELDHKILTFLSYKIQLLQHFSNDNQSNQKNEKEFKEFSTLKKKKKL